MTRKRLRRNRSRTEVFVVHVQPKNKRHDIIIGWIESLARGPPGK